MKAKISEKNVPSSISALQRVSLVLIIGLVTITAVQLSNRSSTKDELAVGLISTRISYKRYEVIGEVNVKVRLLDLLARDMLQYDITADEFEAARRAEIVTLLDTFTTVQFDLAQYRALINETQSSAQLPGGKCRIVTLLEDGSISSVIIPSNKGFIRYISAAQELNNLSLSSYLLPIGPDSAQIPFFFIQRNGLTYLRVEAENRADVFYSYYYSRTDDFSRVSLITMITAIVLLTLCQLFIIPKIFSVNKTNMKVLSLFGFIHPDEVDELAQKCEDYMEKYLDEITAKREDSFYESGELEKTVQQPDNSAKHLRKRVSNVGESQDESQQNYTLQMREFSENIDLPKIKTKSPMTSMLVPDQDSVIPMNKSLDQDKSLGTPMNQRTKLNDDKFDTPSPSADKQNEKGKDKDKQEEEEDEELLEFLNERSKKLKNTKDNNKGVVILQIAAFGMIFLAYFILDFIHEDNFLNNYRKGINHLQLISKRLPNLRFATLFTIEELATNNLTQVYPGLVSSNLESSNYRTDYYDRVAANQREIRASFDISFPDSFTEYFAKLLDFNNKNVCQLFYTDTASQQACGSIGNGELARGLIQAEVALVGASDALMKQFYGISSRNTSTQITFLNSASYTTMSEIMEGLNPIIEGLIDEYFSAFDSYLDLMFIYQRIKFAGLLLCLFLVMLFVWLPYLRRLKSQIFRTKGLLNMIPMDMLKKNRSLRETFTSNEILRAVG